jgi:Putative peptidoglycan binding domain
MTTREQIVATALGFNGTGDGKGYDGSNPFSIDLARPVEAWCGDFVTDIFKRAQVPLPSMQAGCKTGFAYCPDAVEYGNQRHATGNSWQASPGDIVLFDWDNDGLADHTEIATVYQDGVLYTIGGNSGPSNVDHYNGDGGVHRHSWPAPVNTGNDLVLTVLDTAEIVHFGGPAQLTKPGQPVPAGPRLLMLKSPLMKGQDVKEVQLALNKRGHFALNVNSTYDEKTRDAVLKWQQDAKIGADGIVGPATRAALGLPA